MVETSSLADPKILHILSEIKIVAADIDYTLTNFPVSHNAAMKEIGKKYGNIFSNSVSEIFRLIEGQHKQKEPEKWPRKDEFEKIIKQISDIEHDSAEKYGTKRWSRESWMILAAKKLKMNFSKQDVEEARDLYWKIHSDLTSVYDDTKIFLEELKKMKIPLILMTSSDSVMKVQEDLSLSYDPDYSKAYKMNRIKILPFNYESVVVGDPIDKPSPDFFQLVIKEIDKMGTFNQEAILFVGDSFTSDLKTPIDMGYKGLLVKRLIE